MTWWQTWKRNEEYKKKSLVLAVLESDGTEECCWNRGVLPQSFLLLWHSADDSKIKKRVIQVHVVGNIHLKYLASCSFAWLAAPKITTPTLMKE